MSNKLNKPHTKRNCIFAPIKAILISNSLMGRKIYFDNLDALRFFSFLAVFLFHSFHTEIAEIKESSTYAFMTKFLFRNGNLGVNFFFVLSGFLITYLLLFERKVFGKIDIKMFYVRRVLRIWPLYAFCIVFGFILFPIIKDFFGEQSNETANPIFYFFFISNFDLINNGLPDCSVLGVLWSISVEEQFYLLWPLLFAFIKPKYFKYIFLSIIIISISFRFVYDSSLVYEYHTLSCIGDMAIGGLFAHQILTNRSFKATIVLLQRWQILVLYLLAAGFFLFRPWVSKLFLLHELERMLIAAIFGLIILEQNYSRKSIFKLGKLKNITKLGKITYGLYCLHFIGILITITITSKLGYNKYLWQIIILETILSLGISILISQASYQFYEKPFLKLKRKFQRIST